MRNLFCSRADLDSEADVESLFVERLLGKLKYPDDRVLRKDSLEEIVVGRGHRKEKYRPDYVLLDRKRRPLIVVDAKDVTQRPADYHYQVSGYALALNQRHTDGNPVRYTVVTNGLVLLVYPWDSDTPRIALNFGDFEEDNRGFVELRSLLSYGSLDIVKATEDVFLFARPDLNELVRVFDECHQLIWKKEKRPPAEAFYEFAKLMFIKLREDHRIAQMVARGQQPMASDFNFSVGWIEEQVRKAVDDNPVANILFRRIRNELEEKIKSGEKKRIFLKDEELGLWSATITEVVRKLEHYDLHGIDEDLNGRMFETFLNATVRGKALGQFFTPRSVVKYMTRCARFKVTTSELPLVLDGCCGSGGFLIEAMASLVHQIDSMTNLTVQDRTTLKKKLYSSHLFGIDANETIARIARLNMYLHGDGGSKIYATDTLDKDLAIDSGLNQERREEIDELRGHLIRDKMRFDYILTNPPFSMSYSRKDSHESRVLDQYTITLTKAGQPASSAKSNVLFLERYASVLQDRGELLTVIDNTVLNGIDSQRYRDFILENFIIRQVVSLPVNTFFRAEASVQTSILHLRKKEPGEQQGHIFMAILNNVGHDDYQRYTPERDNTPQLAEVYHQWAETGRTMELFEENTGKDESLGCPFQTFILSPERLNSSRLDAFYYAPDLVRTRDTISRRAAEGHLELLNINQLNIVPPMTAEESEEAQGKLFRYFEIGDVTSAGAIINYREEPFEDLPSRARLRVKANDVVFARHRNSRGTAVIIPHEFDGHLVTTGFVAVRPKSFEEALLLWSIFTSEIFKKQVYYLAVTAVQPEIRDEIFRSEFLLPVPKKKQDRERLVKQAKHIRELQDATRKMLANMNVAAAQMLEGN